MEFARIVIADAGDQWFADLEDQEVLAVVEFSFFNQTRVLFSARPVQLPDHLKKYCNRYIHPKHIVLT